MKQNVNDPSIISLRVSRDAGMQRSASVKRYTGNLWRRKRDEGTCTSTGERILTWKKVLILPVPEPEGPFLVLPGRTQARSTWQRR
jgi:hypothetical protein